MTPNTLSSAPAPFDLPTTELAVATVYRFLPLTNLSELRDQLECHAAELGLKGTVLLAEEGINLTMAGPTQALNTWMEVLLAESPFNQIPRERVVWMPATKQPFGKRVVEIRKEIVTFRENELDPVGDTGVHVAPADWNALIEDEGTVLIDTRNDFEVQIGTFYRAQNPDTDNFMAFKQYVADNLETLKASPKVAMFCTGGIRCEKASAYLKAQGVPQVYQLEGGIINYLRQVPKEATRWQGECFIFDDRVSLTHELTEGSYRMEKGQVLPKNG